MTRSRANRSAWRRVALVAGVLLLTAAAGIAADWFIGLPSTTVADYVGRQSCVECHRAEAAQWKGSDHDWAMEHATPETVLGNFENAQFDYAGITSRMFRDGPKYLVETEGPQGELETYEVKYTFGVRPLQQYLVEFPGGRLQCLPLAWDTEQKRWYHLYQDEEVPVLAGDPVHWTGRAQNWNHMCAECHSTNLQKNYDAKAQRFHTTYSEMDVSCEACHGPGSVHVKLAHNKSLFWDRRFGYGLAKLKGTGAKAQLDTCARCHMRRRVVYPGFQPGNELLDHYEPMLLDEGLYFADGQIQDEVYVYGSFLQSLMYRKGVRCSDCHNPHTARLKYEGNSLCTQCHTAGKYDGPNHHFHQEGSQGARCAECHMPERTYMVVDPRRDHSIRVPRPDLSVQLGVPNACTGCHTHRDESNEWARDQVIAWYGPVRKGEPHFAHALDAGRHGRPSADGPLAALVRSKNTGPIVRATAVSLLGQYGTLRGREAVERALVDGEGLVRAAAVRAVESHFNLQPADVQARRSFDQASRAAVDQRLAGIRRLLVPLLHDPLRNVRTEAARVLSIVPGEMLTNSQQPLLDAALNEYVVGQSVDLDQPENHLNLALLYEKLGRTRDAEAFYHSAIGVDAQLAAPHLNLSALYERTGRADEAMASLEEGARLLKRDAGIAATSSAVRYRLGLVLYRLERHAEAVRELETACQLDPRSADYRLALTLLYERLRQWPEALSSARELTALRENDPVSREILSRIERQTHRPQGPQVSGPAPPPR